jgi:hypothetical protein
MGGNSTFAFRYGRRKIAGCKTQTALGTVVRLVVRSYLVEPVEKIEMCPEGPTYVAKGNWDLLALIHVDGAEGGNCTQRPTVPFIIGIAA